MRTLHVKLQAAPPPTLHRIEFTFGAVVTFDCWQVEKEHGPIPMMAHYYVRDSGTVSLASAWVRNKDEFKQWVVTRLPVWQIALIEGLIEDGLRKEHAEDAERRRQRA